MSKKVFRHFLCLKLNLLRSYKGFKKQDLALKMVKEPFYTPASFLTWPSMAGLGLLYVITWGTSVSHTTKYSNFLPALG